MDHVQETGRDSPAGWAIRAIYEHLAEHFEEELLELPAREPLISYGVSSVELIHVLAALERRFRLELGVLVDVSDEQVSVLSLADGLARGWEDSAASCSSAPESSRERSGEDSP